MARGPAVRFAVLNLTTGTHSGVWRVWTQGNEVYLAPRKDAGTYKVSLHSDDRSDPLPYKIAFSQEHWVTGLAPNNAPGPGKAIKQWSRSTAVDGVEHAFFLGFVADALLDEEPLPRSKAIEVVSLHRLDEAAQIDIWICERGVTARPPHPLDPSPLQLKDGRQVWVGAETYPIERSADQDGREWRGSIATFADRDAPSKAPGLVIQPYEVV